MSADASKLIKVNVKMRHPSATTWVTTSFEFTELNCSSPFQSTLNKTILYIDSFDTHEELFAENQNIGAFCSPK